VLQNLFVTTSQKLVKVLLTSTRPFFIFIALVTSDLCIDPTPQALEGAITESAAPTDGSESGEWSLLKGKFPWHSFIDAIETVFKGLVILVAICSVA